MSSPISPRLKAETTQLTRRGLIAAGAGAVFIASFPLTSHAAPEDMRAAIAEVFGKEVITPGRVTLKLPPIAENGFSVPLSVRVDSPMTADDHVTEIGIFSPRNPIAHIAQFHLGPRTGRAEVATRIRLAGTQELVAVARMSDGTLWSGARETVVTLAACVVL
jgi:sulfur-oxidizing protein SoxY